MSNTTARPRLHLIGLFHTETTKAFSHCAFTGKVLRFPKMLQQYGWEVVEYSNGESESSASEKVKILSSEELTERNQALLAARHQLEKSGRKPSCHEIVAAAAQIFNSKTRLGIKGSFHGDAAWIGGPAHVEFERRLIEQLRLRVKPGDFILHPFGRAHSGLVGLFPQQYHVETGIGYPDEAFGAFRIFETYSWLAYHRGMKRAGHNSYEFVVPNYYDLEDWPVRDGSNADGYLLYFGRICREKGIDTVSMLANALQEKIVCVGQGDVTPWASNPYLEFRPPVVGDARGALLAGARALLMPTSFHEPFGGAGVEGMLTGTPLIAHDAAAFAETVIPGVTGYRCHTLDQWCQATCMVRDLDRTKVADTTRPRYSLETCGALYDSIFKMIMTRWDYVAPETLQRCHDNRTNP